MARPKTLAQSPTVTDNIILQISTPDVNGCFLENPYMVDSLTIYYVQRSFDAAQFGEYNQTAIPPTLVQQLASAQQLACQSPTPANLLNLTMLQNQVQSVTITSTFYYNDAEVVLSVGNRAYPAWLSGDPSESPLTNIPYDSNGNPQYGAFQYYWNPNGSVRPGDFFMCYTWTPNPAGSSLSQTIQFTLEGNPNALITIPTHITPPEKYDVMLERYLPEMYKGYLSDNDITPETLQSLNSAIAQAFTAVENQANQIIDLFDANALDESLLVYLSNLFNLKLKSSDPTLWRRQIKEAVPLFKQKGTANGLTQAFAQAGVGLQKITRLWQIVSPYTWQESFRIANTLTWQLANNIVLPIDTSNFELAVRIQQQSTMAQSHSPGDGSLVVANASRMVLSTGQWVVVTLTRASDDATCTYQSTSVVSSMFEGAVIYTLGGLTVINGPDISASIGDGVHMSINAYIVVSNSSVTFAASECTMYTEMTWVGSSQPLPGDIVRVLYSTTAVPVLQQATQNYIRALPLADLRDEYSQLYPPINWNVRLIEEDDPMFQVLIPVRHPFNELLYFGTVRTEFPYSENIYNMDEYNGSLRQSLNPCDIDKDFVDPCGSCLSSKFTLDIAVQELCDDRLGEVYDIIAENVPFHAFVQSLNLSGEVVDFVLAPIERIEAIIMICGEEYTLAGNDNPIFTRTMPAGTTTWRIDRNQMATDIIVASDSGIAYNDYVAFIAPLHDLNRIGLNPASHILEVLGPSPNAGTYQITPWGGPTNPATEIVPIDEAEEDPTIDSVAVSINGSVAQIIAGTVSEPVDETMFTYNLWNINYATNSATITQTYLTVLSDTVLDFVSLGVQGEWDAANVADYTGGIWQVNYGGLHNVVLVLPDGSIVLDVATKLSPSNPISYTLVNPHPLPGALPITSTTGIMTVTGTANVDLNDSNITDLSQYVVNGDYLTYKWSSESTDYLVTGVAGGTIQISEYNGGSAGGATVSIKDILINKGYGYFGYSGLQLTTTVNYEAALNIMNGANPPTDDPTDNSLWKENFLIAIPISGPYVDSALSEAVLDDSMMYFKIAEINGVNITLDGLPQIWRTLAAGGTSVNFDIHHFIKEPVNTEFLTFQQLDRSGKDPVIQSVLQNQEVTISALGVPSGNGVQDVLRTEEAVSYQIEWRDGENTQGEL